MKTLITILFSFLLLPAIAQEGITVCHTPATEKFALFASNSDFNADHPAPLVYIHETVAGKMITFSTPDGKDANAFYLEAPVKSNKYLLVIHEWWGLNEHIKREAENLFNDLGDVNVIALDMYDGNVATTQAEAQKYMGSMKTDRGKSIVEGAMAFAGDGAIFGTIGWCFGGGWSLESTLIAGSAAQACVMYYGMPVQDVARLKTLKAPVLGIFGSQDQWINPDVVKTFEKNMKEAGESLTVEMYDANHAFANPSNPQFDQEATADAYAKTLAFLKANLK
ncbi:dienelactone hydrolase family protein [Fulvivirga sedimenti]|uniref:Dienelactone hydrolase family protein n=1 Tax=Fulvivirga sedimenti TaxID=2879465 RepID=A0A9X1L107_9BACT|nr:dienelactone hydrolase family protein [Fulvivirga sedimenti]MCA6078409.1 dienelactone hydrolase family protein [Fulvivirga sedimenti]